jgi:hypothetical protein
MDRYQLAAPEGMTAEKIFDECWAAALAEATFARLRGELESEGKGHLFQALQGFVVGGKDGFYQQAADVLIEPRNSKNGHLLKIRPG